MSRFLVYKYNGILLFDFWENGLLIVALWQNASPNALRELFSLSTLLFRFRI